MQYMLFRQLSQVNRTSNLTFKFKVNYEDAKAFRKANGGYLRGGQWNDLIVEVYIELSLEIGGILFGKIDIYRV